MAALNFFDRYTSTLSSSYTAGGTSLSVGSAAGLPADGTVNFYLIIKAEGANSEEVFHVTSKTGTTLTVAGAQAGTGSSNHSSGATVIGPIMDTAAYQQFQTDTVAKTGLQQIAQVVTSGSATTVTFSSIPTGFTDLIVTFTTRTTAAVATVGLNMEVNSDTTAADYDNTLSVLNVNGANPPTGALLAPSNQGSYIGNVPGTSALANCPASGEITIYAYSGTTFLKRFMAHMGLMYSASAGQFLVTSGGWLSTSAITSLLFKMSGDVFVDGSVFTLYGRL